MAKKTPKKTVSGDGWDYDEVCAQIKIVVEGMEPPVHFFGVTSFDVFKVEHLYRVDFYNVADRGNPLSHNALYPETAARARMIMFYLKKLGCIRDFDIAHKPTGMFKEIE